MLGIFDFRRIPKKSERSGDPDPSGKNRNVAVVASARKLVTIAFLMLKNNEPYRYAQPLATQNKLSRLRVKATGQRRKTGPKQGTAPSQNQGTGLRTRQLPALKEVYQSEDLPQPQTANELAPAEQRILQERNVIAFVQQIQTAQRIERRPRPAKTLNQQPVSVN